MRSTKHALLLVSSLALFGCDSPVITSSQSVASVALAEQATGAFYFLAPLGTERAATAPLDSAAKPVVEVCALAGTQCDGTPVARFTTVGSGSEQVRRSAGPNAHFIVNWNASRSALTEGAVYRIRVLNANRELGAVNVRVGSPADGDTLPVIERNQTVPVRFRIEQALPASTQPTLHVVYGPGVVGTPAGATEYKPGAKAQYRFRAAPGYHNLHVTLDFEFVPAEGVVTMDQSHVLYVAADPVVTLAPEDRPLMASLRAVYTSTDAVAAYQAYINHIARLVAEMGETEALRRAALVSFLGVDPVRDGAAIKRVDAALAGHSFQVNGASDLRAPRMALAAEGASASAPTTVVFVNGVLNSFNDASETFNRLTIVAGEAGIATPYSTTFHYNRTFSDQIRDQRVLCTQDMSRARQFVNTLALRSRFARCMNDNSYLRNFDFMEALRQVLQLAGAANYATEADALTLAHKLRRELDQNHNVIVVPHSQGNLMTMQAVNALKGLPVPPNTRTAECVAAVSLASPMSGNWPIAGAKLNGIVIKGDFILTLGMNSFPQTSTFLSDSAEADIASVVSPKYLGFLRAAR